MMGMARALAIYERISSDIEGTGQGVARRVSNRQALAERLDWPVGGGDRGQRLVRLHR